MYFMKGVHKAVSYSWTLLRQPEAYVKFELELVYPFDEKFQVLPNYDFLWMNTRNFFCPPMQLLPSVTIVRILP